MDPRYWSYGDDGYYWVPGAWVPVPYEALCGHPPIGAGPAASTSSIPATGGRTSATYGGVNYGFGYMGVGFVGGMWRGHDFVYNTAIMHVNERFVHNTYADRAIVDRYTRLLAAAASPSAADPVEFATSPCPRNAWPSVSGTSSGTPSRPSMRWRPGPITAPISKAMAAVRRPPRSQDR